MKKCNEEKEPQQACVAAEVQLMTVEQLEAIEPGVVFARGTITNHPTEGIYMVDSDIGRELFWLAKRRYDGWSIYTCWSVLPHVDPALLYQYCLDYGDKLRSKGNIVKLVPCTEEAFELYAY